MVYDGASSGPASSRRAVARFDRARRIYEGDKQVDDGAGGRPAAHLPLPRRLTGHRAGPARAGSVSRPLFSPAPPSRSGAPAPSAIRLRLHRPSAAEPANRQSVAIGPGEHADQRLGHAGDGAPFTRADGDVHPRLMTVPAAAVVAAAIRRSRKGRIGLPRRSRCASCRAIARSASRQCRSSRALLRRPAVRCSSGAARVGVKASTSGEFRLP